MSTGGTGMLIKDYRGKNAEQEIWKFDGALVAQINDVLKQAAIEEGQCQISFCDRWSSGGAAEVSETPPVGGVMRLEARLSRSFPPECSHAGAQHTPFPPLLLRCSSGRSSRGGLYYGTLFPSAREGRVTLETLLEAMPAATRFYDVNLRPGFDSLDLAMELLATANVVKLNESEAVAIGRSAAQWHDVTPCYKGEFVLQLILAILAAIRVFLRSRGDTALEVLASLPAGARFSSMANLQH